MVKKRERQENCQSIKFGEERLDPYGIGNLPHVLTITNKSSTFGVRGRAECRITDVFTKFQSICGSKFQTKEGTGNSSWKYVTLKNQRHACRVAELNIMIVCVCKRATKQHEGICPFTRIIKDQTAKASQDYLESSVTVLDINMNGWFFFGKTLLTNNLYHTCMLS